MHSYKDVGELSFCTNNKSMDIFNMHMCFPQKIIGIYMRFVVFIRKQFRTEGADLSRVLR